jgi:hypothetical protein
MFVPVKAAICARNLWAVEWTEPSTVYMRDYFFFFLHQMIIGITRREIRAYTNLALDRFSNQ